MSAKSSLSSHPVTGPLPSVKLPPDSTSPWPHQARIAVVLTFLVESWSEGKAPPYSPMTSPPRPGTTDRAGIQWSEYGPRAGAYRLMRLAKRHNLPATFCVNARVAELFPELIHQIVGSGFELAGHNYAQDQVLPGLSESEERALIQHSLEILTKVSGQRPCGWLSSTIATTDNTADLLAEQKLLWHGDYNYLDQPCRVPTRHGKIVAIPHSDYADNRVLRGSPRDFLQCYTDMFDFLYSQETGSFINITVHGHFGGRPLISAVLDQLLSYIKGHPGVWIPRHDELADWVNAQGLDEVAYAQRFAL